MSIFLLSLTLLMLLVIYFDFTSLIIPNWINGVVLLLYIPFVLTQPEGFDWQMPLLGAAIIFVVGFILFVTNLFGAGDIKLLIALAPWVGWYKLFEYIILVSLLGGALAIIVWLIRKLLITILPKSKVEALPIILQKGEKFAYGLAIAGGFLYFLWAGEIAGVAPKLMI